MKRYLLNVLSVFLIVFCVPVVQAQEDNWPRTLPLQEGTVTIYSLQVDGIDGDIIQYRAALALRATPGSEPVFGAGWFESTVEIDPSSGIVHPTDLKVSETRFPDGTYDIQSELQAVLALESPFWNLDFSVDELNSALQTVEAESKAEQRLNTAPPQIVYRDHPALLVSMDGPPVLRDIENSPYQAVINTPYPLITNDKYYYLNVAKGVWYRSRVAIGPFQYYASPPADIVAMVEAAETNETIEQPLETITAANAPEIVVSTVPTELIVTEGPAAFAPLVDDLLVLQNSDDDVFMHVSSQRFYIVLAGRWYHASSLDGPWTYQLADDLPRAFANIPRNSDQADSRVYVAGTEEARDAVLDAQVPKTTAVARGVTNIEVEYDGKPIYKPVAGTNLVYVNNTDSTVILYDGWYYLVENGIWYVSSNPNGPWQVSDHRPAPVSSILPTSPVYNVKYVHVYHSTPSVVYVGYTPGYHGSYVYNNTIFYGSGWYYPSWVSPRYYYPRHSTWGLNVSYNPWSGWSYGLSWGWGSFSLGYYSGGYWHHNQYWHHGHHGRWGSRGYRPRAVHHGKKHNRYANKKYGRTKYGRKDHNRRGKRAYDQDRRVSHSDLRRKADIRDINRNARRDRLVADNGGNIYRRADRLSGREEDLRPNETRANGASRHAQNRSTDNRRTQNGSINDRRAQNGSINDRRVQNGSINDRRAQNGSSNDRRGQNRSSDDRRTQYGSSSDRRAEDRSSDERRAQNRNSGNRDVQSRSVGNQQRQQPTRGNNTHAQRTRLDTDDNNRQRSSEEDSAQRRVQNNSRRNSQPQRPQNNTRKNTEPTQGKSQRKTRTAKNQRSNSDNKASKGKGGKRAESNRFRSSR